MLKNAAKQAMSIMFMGYHLFNSIMTSITAFPFVIAGNQYAKSWVRFCILHSPRIAACHMTAKHEPVFRRWGASKDWNEEALSIGQSPFMRTIYSVMNQVKTINLSK